MDDKAIAELVNSAVERALGGGGEPAKAAPAAPSQSAPQQDRIDKLVDLMTLQATAAMAQNPVFRSPGAPSGGPTEGGSYNEADPSTLVHATKEEVHRLVLDGKLFGVAKAFRARLPGGSSAVPFSRGKTGGESK